ncbi:hypothetical protein UCREL1_3305 [Eutypa lata UCREL1]|uniref:Uncharacterized protein n=1 Tax=Eutypa lata (strain UCR-EL1) TaxID=1287681 RepID=M7TSP7_EUTLA|nr:hypothetical protein UCREL1_3305 [Eutypa lata UCREL1]
MPKSIKTTGGSNDSTKSPTAKRFELPVLDFKFGSLTEGTNIPAPLPSPKEEAPPPPKKQVPAPEPVKPTKPVLKEEEETNGHVNGTSTMTEERKSKRSSGWFRRLRHHESDNKRVSQQFAPAPPTPKPAGPPPPMIPELSALETKVDTNIGDDIFKGIK